jgi:hypothetical protein
MTQTDLFVDFNPLALREVRDEYDAYLDEKEAAAIAAAEEAEEFGRVWLQDRAETWGIAA